jgi:exosortase H (IPTLxxWG-CTERM-specific)
MAAPVACQRWSSARDANSVQRGWRQTCCHAGGGAAGSAAAYELAKALPTATPPAVTRATGAQLAHRRRIQFPRPDMTVPPSTSPGGLARYRQEVRFLALFAILLGGGFALLAWNPVNDRAVVPFTAAVASWSGGLLNLVGQGVTRDGTVLRSARFAVNIENGCNGVETLVIFFSAVLAFPASWRAKAAGLLFGSLAIQVVNLVRVAALFLTGVYLPELFDSSHTVIWQTIVVLCGVLLWLYWAQRFAQPARQRIEPRPAAEV